MEFEEMKKIWDTQRQEYSFTIDHAALHRRVVSKQRQGLHIANMSEWMLIGVNFIASLLIAITVFSKEVINISMAVLSSWMLFTALYVAYRRSRRLNEANRFDRTLNGDLQFALDVARYQVQLSNFGRWNILPIGVLSLTGLLEAEKPFWIALLLVAFLVMSNYAAGWESGYYKKRMTELEMLKHKLEEPV